MLQFLKMELNALECNLCVTLCSSVSLCVTKKGDTTVGANIIALAIKIFVLVLLSCLQLVAFCQETKLSESIISIAEDLASDETDPESVSLYIEKLYDIYENPVNINSADKDEIARLFFLSDFQVKVLVDYVNTSGKIISVYEIANLPGFDKETASMLNIFIRLDENIEKEEYKSRWRNTFMTNVIWKPADNDTSWIGSDARILAKYKFNAGGFSGGVLAEKDQGEKLLNGNPPLPDLLSGHIAWNGKGIIRRMIIGDYSARFGQGSNINTTMRTGLSLHSPGYMAAKSEIRPYTSTDENNFFRGAAAELAFKKLSLSLFYSRNSIDASLSASANSEPETVTSFYTTGLHNTISSLKKKDALTDLNYGMNFSYNLKNFRTGATWSEEQLSLPVTRNNNDPGKIYDFAGIRNSIYTLYYNALVNRILLFGELSANESFKYSAIQGVTLRPSDRLIVNLLYRNNEDGFFSMHGKTPGSSSTSGGSNALLGNFTFEAAKYLFISAGCDFQKFSWLKYRTSSPSYTNRREIRLKYSRSEKLVFEGAYYLNLSTSDNDKITGIPGLEETITRTFTGSFRYSFAGNLTLGTKLCRKTAYPSESKGSLLLQDVNYRFTRIPVTVWLRYCVFNTDNWDTRIYTYENDLLYSFSIPALYGSGSKNYIMISWKISDSAEIRFKYGILSKQVTGNETLNEEFRFQIRVFI